MLENLVPRLPPGATVHVRDDDTAVVASPVTGQFLEIAADEGRLAVLFDGKRSIRDVVSTQFTSQGAVSFQALADLLARLRGAGLLLNPAEELDAAGVSKDSVPGFIRRAQNVFLVRFAGPVARSIHQLGAPLFLSACLLMLSTPLLSSQHHKLNPMLPGGHATAGLIGILVGVWLASAMRGFVRAFVGRRLGAPPGAIELRASFGLPLPRVQWGQILLLPRAKRFAVWMATLAASWLFAASAGVAAWSGRVGPTFASIALGAAIVGFIDLLPFGTGAFGHALATLSGRVDLREHARAYTSRRLVSRLGTKGYFSGEEMLLVSALLSVIWGVVFIRLIAHTGTRYFVRLMRHSVSSRGLEALSSRLLELAILVALVAALIQLGWILIVAIRATLPNLTLGRARQGKAVDDQSVDASAGLHRVPIFSGLPENVLAEVAREASVVEFAPRAVIVREGDPGDRFFAVISGLVEVLHEQESGLVRKLGTLGEGDCFGEMALLHPGPRTATVRAKTRVRLVSVSRAGFERLMQALPGVDLTRTLRATAALRRSPLAASIPATRMTEIVPRLVRREVQAGEVIFREGDPGDYFFLIDTGEVEIVAPDGERLASLSQGESFGETALLLATPRTATARATQPTSLWALSRVDLYSVLSRNASLSHLLEQRASERVGKAA